MQKFEQGTDRSGFKKALLKAFQSAHNEARFGTEPTTQPKVTLPRNQNVDTRAPALGVRRPKTEMGYGGGHAEEILGGGTHQPPGVGIRMGTASQNVDRRRMGLMTDGHQATRVKLTSGSATNRHALLPRGHQVARIKLPRMLNTDTRSLRKGSGV